MMKKLLTTACCLMLVFALFAFSACGNTSTDISGATSIADLKGAKISAQTGTFHANARNQIEDVQGQLYEDFDTLLTALQSNSIDGYIAEEPTAIAICQKDNTLDYLHFVNNQTGFTATVAETAIAIGCKEGSALVSQINTVLATITETQKSTLMEQVISVNNGGTVTTYAVSNTAQSATSGTLKVAMECAYAPFNWTQTDSANGAVPISSSVGTSATGLYANGYDVQIAKYVANALGLTLEIYSVSWDSLISGVQAGTYDCIIAGMSPTAEREEEIDFTDTYYVSNLVVIYKKG